MPPERFAGKKVWITGASSGIGEALARAFHGEGARLVLSARNEPALRAVKGTLGNGEEERVAVLPLDLSRPDTLAEGAEAAWNVFEGVDILVHNAGIAQRDLALNTDLAVDRRIMEVNYFGAVALTKEILPRMIANGSGHLVVVSSLSSKYGIPKLTAYAASKHALHGFFDSLRAEVHPHGIRITLVIPGIIRTPITRNALVGDGTVHGKMEAVHERGMSAEACAAGVLDAVARGKEEALVGGMETLTVHLHRFFPVLFSRMIRNHPVRAWRRWKTRLRLVPRDDRST
jgi:short-subunit dehydrogenase